MEPQILIRRATTHDVPSINNIWEECIPSKVPPTEEDVTTWLGIWNWRLEQPSQIFLVACETQNPNIVLGFIRGGVNWRQDGTLVSKLTFTFEENQYSYDRELISFFITEKAQRKGVGSLLFQGLLSELRKEGAKSLVVWTGEGLPKAVQFYQKTGGKLVSRSVGEDQEVHVAFGYDL